MDAASSVTCALAALALRLKNGQLTTAGKALLGALPILLMQWRQRLQRQKAARGKHPGTAEQRALCFNPAIQKEDFEERFIGTKEALESGSFDYIVVGSGSAGCPLAARLAKAGASVLLVEAGGEAQRSMEVQMPKKMWRLWQSEVDWGFRSVPQEKLLPPGRRLDMERGKTLGGSSAINYNMWVRGAPEDYDRWAEEFQCQGWSYQEVLPHFKSVERVSAAIGDASGDAASSAAAFRGRGGAVKVNTLHPPMEEVEDFLRACEETGDARNEDYNGPRLPGVGYTQFNTEGGREDCFNAFIEPILRWYPNLHVASETFCRKVLLEKTDGQVRATGVQVELRTGDILEVKCRREVVLSAGALLTPQILMLSGIGEAKHLKEHGIECVRELPVGQNLQDHPLVPTVLLGEPKEETMPRAAYRNSSSLNAQLFWQSEVDKKREEELKRPLGADIQIILVNRPDPSMGLKAGIHLLGQNVFHRLSSDYRRDYKVLTDFIAFLLRNVFKLESVKSAFTQRFYSVTMLNNHAQSRGTVRLASANPHDLPIVDPQYFTDPDDVKALIQGYRRIRAIMTHPIMTKHFDPAGAVPVPASDAPDSEIDNYIRSNAQTTWHYSCTTPMGPIGDPKAVCDVGGRVQGVAKLRVCDAGLMPKIVSGNTNCPCIMMGDKIGALMASDFAAAAASAAPGVSPVALKSSL